jgi:hypothetical protein
MPVETIARDGDDPSIIKEHETREISPLPSWAAANKYTNFVVLKEYDMTKNKGISPEDRQKLITLGIDEEIISRMEGANAQEAKEIEDLGLESKETEAEEVADEVADEAAESAPSDEGGESTGTEEDEDEIGKSIEGLYTIVKAIYSKVDTELGNMNSRLSEIEDAQADTQKQIGQTPLASRISFLKESVIGNEATRVDGRTTLGKDAPAETSDSDGKYQFFWQDKEF